MGVVTERNTKTHMLQNGVVGMERVHSHDPRVEPSRIKPA